MKKKNFEIFWNFCIEMLFLKKEFEINLKFFEIKLEKIKNFIEDFFQINSQKRNFEKKIFKKISRNFFQKGFLKFFEIFFGNEFETFLYKVWLENLLLKIFFEI